MTSDIKKCEHGVYDPHGDGAYCQMCNPSTNIKALDATKSDLHFNRRSALSLTETGKLPKCSNCATILTVSNNGTCHVCGTEHTIDAPEHLRANNAQPGICPSCGSGVHYTTKTKRKWQCADCGREYVAPKRAEDVD